MRVCGVLVNPKYNNVIKIAKSLIISAQVFFVYKNDSTTEDSSF